MRRAARMYCDRWSSRLASELRLRSGRTLAAPRAAPPPRHVLTLYEYEASPWCRLVREQLAVLDLRATVRPCPRQTLRAEGAFSPASRFRPAARRLWDDARDGAAGPLTFPLLVDETESTCRSNGQEQGGGAKEDGPIVITESYKIVQHLWATYGRSVLPPARIADVPTSAPTTGASLLRRAFSPSRRLPTCDRFRAAA